MDQYRIKQLDAGSHTLLQQTFDLCRLHVNHAELAEQHALVFSDIVLDAQPLRSSLIEIRGKYYWLLSADPAQPDMPENNIVRDILVRMRCNTADSRQALDLLRSALNLKDEDIINQQPYLGPARWELYRIDDNGNEFAMQRLQTLQCAYSMQQEYQAKGHKQSYYIRELV